MTAGQHTTSRSGPVSHGILHWLHGMFSYTIRGIHLQATGALTDPGRALIRQRPFPIRLFMEKVASRTGPLLQHRLNVLRLLLTQQTIELRLARRLVGYVGERQPLTAGRKTIASLMDRVQATGAIAGT